MNLLKQTVGCFPKTIDHGSKYWPSDWLNAKNNQLLFEKTIDCYSKTIGCCFGKRMYLIFLQTFTNCFKHRWGLVFRVWVFILIILWSARARWRMGQLRWRLWAARRGRPAGWRGIRGRRAGQARETHSSCNQWQVWRGGRRQIWLEGAARVASWRSSRLM